MLAVKSSVSIVLTGGFADLSVTVYVTMEQFLTAFVLVIPFYFGARTEKRINESNVTKGSHIKTVFQIWVLYKRIG